MIEPVFRPPLEMVPKINIRKFMAAYPDAPVELVIAWVEHFYPGLYELDSVASLIIEEKTKNQKPS